METAQKLLKDLKAALLQGILDLEQRPKDATEMFIKERWV